MAYGSPNNLEEVKDYYTHIRGGKKPRREELEELINKYKAIGGKSPLLDITRDQAISLERELKGIITNSKVYIGMRHSKPFIADTVKEIKRDKIEKLIGIVLAPHYSILSVEVYHEELKESLKEEKVNLQLKLVKSWHNNEDLIEFWVDSIRPLIKENSKILFTAHSLPERILNLKDPYPEQLMETCKLISSQLKVSDWTFAYQSASKGMEPWLGPDILEKLREIKEEGYNRVIVAPIGFVSDNLEILYDIDIEAKKFASSINLELVRANLPNRSDKLTKALLSLVKANL